MIRGVAISGKAGSGKTVFAHLLGELLDHEPAHLSFGNALKFCCERDWGITKDMPGGREALLRYGDQERAKDPDVFLKALWPDITEAWHVYDVPLIDDLRMENELAFVNDHDFVTIRIHAPAYLRRLRIEARGDDPAIVDSDTVTETALDAAWCGHHVINTGSIADLAKAARDIARLLPAYSPYVGPQSAMLDLRLTAAIPAL